MTTDLEPVDSFRDRARRWLKENLPPTTQTYTGADHDEVWDRARELQRILSDGDFAGICFPKAYGGQGLTPAHQQAFTEESLGYEMPLVLNVPTLAICAATVSGGIWCTPVTPTVFCTVTAHTARQPCTPQVANVRRSAAMPAPPPESVPAIVMAFGGVIPTGR